MEGKSIETQRGEGPSKEAIRGLAERLVYRESEMPSRIWYSEAAKGKELVAEGAEDEEEVQRVKRDLAGYEQPDVVALLERVQHIKLEADTARKLSDTLGLPRETRLEDIIARLQEIKEQAS